MLRTLVIPTDELLKMAQDLLDKGATQAAISFIEADDSDPDDPIPPGVHFYGYMPDDDDAAWDFGEIEAIQSSS